MEKLRARLQFSFSTKVLLPVVTVMVLLLAVTVWVVNQRLTKEFQSEARQSLATADKVFRKSQDIRKNYLVSRYRNLRNEPRYRAVLQSGHMPTLRDEIRDLPDDQGVDVALFTLTSGERIVSAKPDPLRPIPVTEFETRCEMAVKRAMEDAENVDTILVGERLFDVVSIPARGADGTLIGVLTFGSELRAAEVEEFSLLNRSEIVLVAEGRIIASTVANQRPPEDFAQLFRECLANAKRSGTPERLKELLLNEQHYYCSAGTFTSLSGAGKLGYLLLSSYEQPLRALQTTQQMLLLVSGLGILFGTATVWFLVRKTTQPLRELRDSAEAVGKGDFSRRVEAASRDECGELAAVFNQMTENVKRSREQLESTVETLKSTQAQLVQSEKLSGIGEFVAGVAHELNNPLTTVMGFSELLGRSEGEPQHKRHLDLIHKSAIRCHKIVQSLLSFARRHQPERKLSSVNELVESAIDFLQYQLRTNNVEVVTRLEPTLPKAMVDPHQVQQVFLNLLNNARQAIEAHQPNGCIRISTETYGQLIRIVFQDNGPGISEANLSKVFDPFFTTKEVGKGTGLGLSLCYGIIKEHGGAITVRSRQGEGAAFEIVLPLVEQLAEPQEKIEPTVKIVSNEREGTGKKVLAIDDEDAILLMVRETLSEHGYEVHVAQDGESALRCLEQTSFDLVLCDWKMPGLNGEQIYERMRVSNPVLSERMIFFTGDVINEKAQRFLGERHKVCLSKPFSLVEFRAAIGQALAAG